MDKIVLYLDERKIVLPRTRSIKISGEIVCKEAEMADGTMIREVKGYRAKVSAEWNWLPEKTITQIHAMLRTGRYVTVEYPDPAEGTKTEVCSVGYPETGIFTFRGGNPRWMDVKLECTGTEVKRYAKNN